MTTKITFISSAACLEAGLIQFPGTWPQSFTKLWVGLVFQESFWRKKQGSKEGEWNKVSFNSAVNVWSGVLSFPLVQEITSGRFKVTRIQEPTFPIFSHKLVQNLLLLCTLRRKPLSCPMPCKVLQESASWGVPRVSIGGIRSLGWAGIAGTQQHHQEWQIPLQTLALRSFAQLQFHLPCGYEKTCANSWNPWLLAGEHLLRWGCSL